MVTIEEIIHARRNGRQKPDGEQLRRLPDRLAEIHGRLSGFTQVQNSHESVKEIASLVALAKHDGYNTALDPSTVERWLADIQAGAARPGVLEDGEVIVNCLGLGISGSLPEDKRPDLTRTIELLKQGGLGAIYVTEGANRLSRDPDRVVSYTLLKLMKGTNCKLRTPEDVLSPCIERDWDIIHEELEEGAEELKRMHIRLHRRKKRKAERGAYVGEPIPAGFILPIIGQKPSGEYELGKLEPYLPHARVVIQVLRELVRQRSLLKTAQAVKDLTFPFFPKELAYMESRSALRRCLKTPSGYRITPELVKGLATNPKLIGVWQWGDGKPMSSNHEAIVPDDLFVEAYEVATCPSKSKGRAVDFEPLEWAGLLWCMNDPQLRLIHSHNSDWHYVCDHDYQDGQGPICLDITARFVDEPLTGEVLHQLDFSPYAEEVLAKLEEEAAQGKLEEVRRKQEEAALEQSIKKWQALLPCCVDPETSQVDRDKEEYYWRQIREAQAQLEAVRAKPAPKKAVVAADVGKVRDFLARLPHNWQGYPRGLRNRLLKLLIERVELRHDRKRIEANMIWRSGFEQQITIYRPKARSGRGSRWSEDEERLLRMLWPSSSPDVLLAAFANRSWNAIAGRAFRLCLKRERQYHPPNGWRPWTGCEDEKLKSLYEAGTPLLEIASELHRSSNAVETRASTGQLVRPAWARWKKDQVTWEVQSLKVLQGQSLGR